VNITTFKKGCITVLVQYVLIFTKQGWQKSNRRFLMVGYDFFSAGLNFFIVANVFT